MLKIRDNVNLKELEKFGFELNERQMYVLKKKVIIPCYCYSCELGNTDHHKEEIIDSLYVDPVMTSKTISRIGYGGENSYWYNEMSSKEYDVLYDLIKANLVEKVEE